MMLRHIISVSLAMTACVTLIPTKANAVSLTLVPVNGLQRERGDEMKFSLVLNPSISENNLGIQFGTILSNWNQDESELSRRGLGIEYLINPGTRIRSTTTIATFTFDVLQPVKDGNSDLFDVTVLYRVPFLRDGEIEYGEPTLVSASNVVDVEPVPEPLTMFGAATALGYGAILKRKYAKNTES